MHTLLILSAFLMLLSIVFAADENGVNVPPTDQVLKSLKKDHPRLMASQADFDRLAKQFKEDKHFIAVADKLIKAANKIIDEPASEYVIPDGKRLLATSRRVMERVYTLAMAFHLTQDRKYVDRCWAELETAAAFVDWNPSHFLDTAEMTTAFALGYDWLYHQWSDDQRKTIRNAIVRHGLAAGQKAYDQPMWWTKAEHNWNQVCNGGLIMGALAIGDEEPGISAKIIQQAATRMPLAIRHYGPDGAWNEGPGYWAYATRYTSRPLEALKTAMGTDFGLSKISGLSNAGKFPLHFVGTSGLSFNYADAKANWDGAPDIWWFASRYNQPDLAAIQYPHAIKKPHALDLLWGTFGQTAPQIGKDVTPDAYFRITEVATFSTRPGDTRGMFAGLKSGDSKANHSNLDLGSFVLDSDGQRFILDLGPDNYNLPDYFGKARWTYYRLRAEAHNTLVIGPDDQPDQDPKAAAKITRYESNADRGFAITDLSAAYQHGKSVTRGLWFDRKNNYVLLQDQIVTESAKDVWWFAHSEASIEPSPDNRAAKLILGGKQMTMRLIAPADAKFTFGKAQPLPTSPNPEGQAKNKATRIAIHLPNTTDTRIVVIFTPGDVVAPKLKVVPLKDW